MSPPRLAIVGAGGHGREIREVLRAVDPVGHQYQFVGYIADERPARVPAELWLGGVDGGACTRHFDLFVLGVGDPRHRRRIAEELQGAGAEATTLVHPSANVAGDAELAPGVVVWPQAAMSVGVRVGTHAHINQCASVSHDVIVGSCVTVAPGATVCGSVELGDGAWVGAGAVVLQNLRVGAWCTVGAGAVVTRTVTEGTVVGVPARSLDSRVSSR